MFAGERDIDAAVAELADELPAPLRPLARVAFDYRWSWAADGAGTFAAIDAAHWARCSRNPRRLLTEGRRCDSAQRTVPLEPMLEKYYKIRGYDADGIPTPRTLQKLGIAVK